MGTDMSGIGSYYTNSAQNTAGNVDAARLSSSIENLDTTKASDEELMASCKEFENYLVEQVMKSMEKTIMKDEEEEESSYLEYFGDTLYKEYASKITEQTDLGIAQMLYESMKRE